MQHSPPLQTTVTPGVLLRLARSPDGKDPSTGRTDAPGPAPPAAPPAGANIAIMAPSEDAFAAALAALKLTPEELLADTATLASIIKYHLAAFVVRLLCHAS